MQVPSTRAQRKRKRKRTLRGLLWVVGALLSFAAGLLVTVTWAWEAKLRLGTPAAHAADPGAEESTTEIRDRVLVLVLGVDKREGDGGRSDTIMVGALDPGRNTIGLVSILRDTWAEIPGHGWDKINHAYAYGGYELARKAVARLLDLPLEHFVIIDFQGFEQLVDAVGGVEIDVEKRMYYADPYQNLVIDLRPGVQVLDGKRALHYARFRADSEGDVGRVRRQQQVIRALMARATSPDIAPKVPALVRSLFETVRTDLSLPEALRLALTARKMVSGGAELRTATVTGTDRMMGGVYYLIPDLVTFRQEAYRVLVGEEPPADFVERARAAQARMEEAVRAAVEKARAAEAAAPRRAGNESRPGAGSGANGSGAGENPGGVLPAEAGPPAGDGGTGPAAEHGGTDPAGGTGTDPGNPPDSAAGDQPGGDPGSPPQAGSGGGTGGKEAVAGHGDGAGSPGTGTGEGAGGAVAGGSLRVDRVD